MTASSKASIRAGWTIIQADASRIPLADGSVHCAFTSVPYWSLRRYEAHDNPACIGLEASPQEWAARLVGVFRECRRVMRDDATLFVNCGDCFSSAGGSGRQGKNGQRADRTFTLEREGGTVPVPGFPAKCLIPLPWILAFAMIEDSWILRSWIPWLKASPMPESVTDRPSKACEVVLMFSKSANYFWDGEAVKRRSNYEWNSAQSTFAKPGEKKRGAIAQGLRTHGGDTFHPDEPRGDRNFRQSDLFMDSLRGLLVDDDGDPLAVCTSSEPMRGRHYACFPPKLVEAFIPACVPKKCCAKCGAGHRRVVERTPMVVDRSHRNNGTGMRTPPSGTMTSPPTSRTVGWQPGCECATKYPPETRPPVPGILLDPFNGAGSSAIACIRQGRRYVGVELSSEYCELSRRRIAKYLRPTVEKPLVEAAEDLPLFASTEEA